MKLINDAYDSEYFATKVQNTTVCMWFRRLPGWVRRTGIRIARGDFRLNAWSEREPHYPRALESIAYQTRDVLEAMQADSVFVYTRCAWMAAQ